MPHRFGSGNRIERIFPTVNDVGRPQTQRNGVVLIQSMVFAGGVAALSWEVVWQLQATLAFGVSAAGTALTLAASMGGMTVGALTMGSRLRGRVVRRPLRLYGILELVIGICGLLLLPGFRLLESFDAVVYTASPALAPLIHAGGMTLLLAPATLAMGATVPVFQLVARRFGTSVSVLYGMNTAGAAGGVLLLSFWLLPTFGVSTSCALVALLNGTVFLVAAFVETRAARSRKDADAETEASDARGLGVPAIAQITVLCTGFATFGLEVAWFRALRAAFWSTSSTFAIMLAAVLIPLALGARCVPWLRRRNISPRTPLFFAGVAILLATPLVERMDLVVAIDQPFGVVLVIWLLMTLIAIGPAVFFLATALPWYLEAHPEPSATGRLYGLNTLGSVAGSLLAAWGLLPWLGSSATAWGLGVLVLTLAFMHYPARGRIRVGVVGGIALVVAVVTSSGPGLDRMYGERSFRGNRILAHDEGPDFTTSVIQWATGDRYLYIDGFSATTDDPVAGHYMYWMGALPARLHPDPQRGLVICFGTGQTTNAVRQHVRGDVDVVDVSRAVLDMAPHFGANQSVLEDPRVHPIVMDGRAWLRRSREAYDVITLEPMPPNFAGVNSLYSKEFYEIMSRRLAPGGVVAQWLPVHLLDPTHAASIAATFVGVFPDSILWVDPVGGTSILAGRREGAEEGFGRVHPGPPDVPANRKLDDEEIQRSLLLDRESLGRYAKTGTLVTDDNQMLQFSQLRAGLRGKRTLTLNRLNSRILSEFARGAAERSPTRSPHSK